MNKVLIIDDDKELCTLIKRSVLSENIEADICNTGKEGLKKLKEKEYQLVILDVMMPGMDGFETLEEIRKGNSTKRSLSRGRNEMYLAAPLPLKMTVLPKCAAYARELMII